MIKLTWTESGKDAWVINDPKGRPYLTAYLDGNREPGWVFLYLRKPDFPFKLVRRIGRDLLFRTVEDATESLEREARTFVDRRYRDQKFNRVFFIVAFVAICAVAVVVDLLPAQTQQEKRNLQCSCACQLEGNRGGEMTLSGKCGCYLKGGDK